MMVEYTGGLEDRLDLPESTVIVLESRYLPKNGSGEITKTWDTRLREISKNISHGEAFYLPELKNKVQRGMSNRDLYAKCKGNKRIKEFGDKLYGLMASQRFLFNSPTLMNADNSLQQLSACFVLPIEDSMEKIFETMKYMAMVHKSGGGTGFSFSRLRPNGAFIGGTQSYSPGPVSFLKAYNAATEIVKQGGRRRGANMAVIRANHPDSLCFTRIKNDPKMINNFNISIAFTDEEVETIKNNGRIYLKDPRGGVDYTIENARARVPEITFEDRSFKTSWKLSEDEKSIIDSYSGKEIGGVEDGRLYFNAGDFFDVIAEGAWKTGDPGVIFLDAMNRDNPTPQIGKIESTNPCGEQPLLPFESCNLGSIDLSEHFTTEGKFDESLLEETVRLGIRALDNVIDMNRYPIRKIEKMTLANRKIGLGVMGFAGYLVKKGISYQSPEAVEEAEKIMEFIDKISKDESRKLAKERGAFPNFEKSVYYERGEKPIRNATTTTIAPTGTLSIINSSTSSGAEPLYLHFQRRKVGTTIGRELIEINKTLKEWLEKRGIYDEALLLGMAEEGKGLEDMLIPKSIKDEIKHLFPTAHEIIPEQHLAVQAAFQKHTDNAVSKTVNIPKDSTIEDIRQIYLMAYDLGCKGVTIYRDKSREDQLLTGVKKQILEEKVSHDNPLKIPNIITSIKIKQPTPEGNLHVHMSLSPELDYAPVETFGTLANAGSKEAADIEAMGRLASLILRAGGYKNPAKVINQLKEIGSKDVAFSSSGQVGSIPMGLAKALLKYELAKRIYPIEDVLTGKIDFDSLEEEVSEIIREDKVGIYLKRKGEEPDEPKKIDAGNCPDCGSKLRFEEGCSKCGCGFSSCS